MGLAGADDGLAASFAADGVVCVRSVLDPDEVAAAARGIEAVLPAWGRSPRWPAGR